MRLTILENSSAIVWRVAQGSSNASLTYAAYALQRHSVLVDMKLNSVVTFFLAYCLCGLQHVQGGKSGDGYFYGRATFYDDNQQ